MKPDKESSSSAAPASGEGMPDYPAIKVVHDLRSISYAPGFERRGETEYILRQDYDKLRSYALTLRRREEMSAEQIRLEQVITEAILLTTDSHIEEFLRRNCPRWALHTAAPAVGGEEGGR
jgi:hypothetical protein